MGDVGSGALGYAVAAVLALASVKTDIHWILLLVSASPFLVDAGFTLLARIISGQRWMEPHTQHVYQRAVQAGASHAQVTGMYFALGLFSITVLNVCSNLQPRWEAAVVHRAERPLAPPAQWIAPPKRKYLTYGFTLAGQNPRPDAAFGHRLP